MTEEAYIFPLSYGQERLWFLDQLEPGSAAYNIFDSTTFSGPLEVAALERALNEVVRRHESLRTSFMALDEQPMQVISPSLSLSLSVVDLRELSADERLEEATRLSAEESS